MIITTSPKIKYPPIPNEIKDNINVKWLFALFPSFLRPHTKIDELFVCNVNKSNPVPSRSDIQIHWISKLSEINIKTDHFMQTSIGKLIWHIWKRRIAKKNAQLGIAEYNHSVTHFSFIIQNGSSMISYKPIMRQGNCAIIGPCYTESSARGKGIYPFVLANALHRLQIQGYKWAYIHARANNVASLRGIRKNRNWEYIGQFLLKRRPFRRYKIMAANINTCHPVTGDTQ